MEMAVQSCVIAAERDKARGFALFDWRFCCWMRTGICRWLQRCWMSTWRVGERLKRRRRLWPYAAGAVEQQMGDRPAQSGNRQRRWLWRESTGQHRN